MCAVAMKMVTGWSTGIIHISAYEKLEVDHVVAQKRAATWRVDGSVECFRCNLLIGLRQAQSIQVTSCLVAPIGPSAVILVQKQAARDYMAFYLNNMLVSACKAKKSGRKRAQFPTLFGTMVGVAFKKALTHQGRLTKRCSADS